MKPAPFDYADPESLDEVLDLLAEHGDDAVVIAGGQSLIPLLNLRLARPSLVVDPRRVTELRRFDADGDGLRVGSLVTMLDLEESAPAGSVPGLHATLAHVAHRLIRARATVGGSVAHADPAAELPALLVAVDGEVRLRSRDRGDRTVAARDFLVGALMTDRAADELVVEVRVPAHPGRLVVHEMATRPGDFALVGCIAGFGVVADRVTAPTVTVFGAAGTAVRCTEAEAVLQGEPPSADLFVEAAATVARHLDARDDTHASARYRRQVAAILAARALGAAAPESRETS